MDRTRKYKSRYNLKWERTSNYCLKLMDYRCILGNHRAVLVHHSMYGIDITGWSIFPLCRKCHEFVHHPGVWIPNESLILCRNTPEFTNFLRAKFYAKYQELLSERGLTKPSKL